LAGAAYAHRGQCPGARPLLALLGADDGLGLRLASRPVPACDCPKPRKSAPRHELLAVADRRHDAPLYLTATTRRTPSAHRLLTGNQRPSSIGFPVMRRGLRTIEQRVLPRGWTDVLRQILL